MSTRADRSFWQFFIAATGVAATGAFYQTLRQLQALGVMLAQSKWSLLLGLLAANVIGAALLAWRTRAKGPVDLPAGQAATLPTPWHSRVVGGALFIVGFALVWLVRLQVLSGVLPQLFPFIWIFLWLTLLQTAGLRMATGKPWQTLFACLLLLQGVTIQIYGQLRVVSEYPFSIGYSEAGRHYYASLFFSKALYGEQTALPFLHPSRYLLMSIPFLAGGLSLALHRLWQALLWIVLTGVSAWLLARRLALRRRAIAAYIVAWAFLFFLQGAVYYHLQVCVIIVLAGVSKRHPLRSAMSVLAASIWAGISRINWLPIPAMLAASIYILETPMAGLRTRYWLKPALWGGLGLLAGAASQLVYARLSRNPDSGVFASSLTSSLLWDRLLPNSTFPMGILPGAVILVLPCAIGVWHVARVRWDGLHWQRWAALALILLALFLGGLVVSVKIGGGADLHNLDGFFVHVALISSSLFAGRVATEPASKRGWGKVSWPVILSALLIPVCFSLPQVAPRFSYDPAAAADDLQKLQQAAGQAAAQGGEILLVSERQLLAFHQLPGVALVPDYEQIELMEMAMSGNRAYLEKYYRDLANHRFAVIIAEDQKFTERKRGAFVEENRAWVHYAGAPLLCAYKPVLSLASANIQVFVPRPEPPGCPDPFSR